METVKEHHILNSAIEPVKSIMPEESTVAAVESNVCHKSNGVDGSSLVISNEEPSENKIDIEDSGAKAVICNEPLTDNVSIDADKIEVLTSTNVSDNADDIKQIEKSHNIINENNESQVSTTETTDGIIEISVDGVEYEASNVISEEVITETSAEENNDISSTKEVKFETEILIETNDNDINENIMIENQVQDPTHNILSELDHNIELSEVLRSSDVMEENNSDTVRQEVFNKEELLDILEGNDNDSNLSAFEKSKMLEAQIALKQLSKLQGTRKKYAVSPRIKKGEKKPNSIKKSIDPEPALETETIDNVIQPQVDDTDKKPNTEKIPETENIVSALVMDWDDDDPGETVVADQVPDTKDELKIEEQVTEVCPTLPNIEEINQALLDSTVSEECVQNASKSGDEGPPRRVSRVIKKKVIFDPDNPDTFTKGKPSSKNKEIAEVPLPKKVKTEHIHQRSNSKSPLAKLQWKKPSPKNNKQNKRLSEVDKLLMDEGAVNMICQLTPEAPKGKKNMKTKAEFIKKLQSSTPEGKEMKFRERKKELEKSRIEECEAKRILSGRHRASLTSSVKSPSMTEDFETHSADDSIIYRRHSSSSYSSSCMSPRRLSDVETGTIQNALQTNQQIKDLSDPHLISKDRQSTDVFMADSALGTPGSEIINKNDCLSIKEKLNTKLSLALNKRKRDITKTDKPPKQKRISKGENECQDKSFDQFKFISITLQDRLAIVSIKKTLKIGIEIIKELEEALYCLDRIKDISVTLLTSQCGTLCSSLDLNLLLEENKETRVKQAYALADSIRLLLCSVAQHSKLVCCSVWGACSGVALALATLSDVVLASECATFALAPGQSPMFPGAAALTARCRALPQSLINDLVIFGRRISSAEALQGGLISRRLWPDRFEEQVSNIVKDIATQPMQTMLLKKKLLNLKNNSEDSSLSACLEAERDLLFQYWTSAEGQQLLRATVDAV